MMKKRIQIILMIIFLIVTILPLKSHASTGSISADWFNKVFGIELTDGDSIFNNQEDNNTRLEINNSIYSGSADSHYSLYDRFGGNISFIPYFGEKRISTNLSDKFYEMFLENAATFELTFKQISEILFAKTKTTNNCIYENRPNILSDNDISSGYRDPRVSAYSSVSLSGGNAALGSYFLSISNLAAEFTSWISSSGFYRTLNDVFVWACEAGIAELMQTIASVLLPFVIFITILSLVSRAIKFIKKGDASIRDLLLSLVSYLLSLGLIFSLMFNPTAFSNIMLNVTSFIDNVFDEALNSSASDNEIINSSNIDNVRTASLWYTAVFQPWCNGMFQSDYEYLYTQYSDKEDRFKMPQSHDDTTSTWSDGSKRYNSAYLTGDISVPRGGDKFVKNWAALAYSCQSIYHINASADDDLNTSITLSWPKGTVCPNNSNIYIDNFRWLDAKLNISPEYYDTSTIVASYSDSKIYEETFVDNGMKSLYMALLLIPISIVAIRKLKFAVFILASGVKLWYYSIMNFVSREQYNVLSNFKKFLSPIYDYFWWGLICFLMIVTYQNMAGKSIAGDIVYLLISIYFMTLKPIRHTAQVTRAIRNVKEKAGKAINKAASAVERKIRK